MGQFWAESSSNLRGPRVPHREAGGHKLPLLSDSEILRWQHGGDDWEVSLGRCPTGLGTQSLSWMELRAWKLSWAQRGSGLTSASGSEGPAKCEQTSERVTDAKKDQGHGSLTTLTMVTHTQPGSLFQKG